MGPIRVLLVDDHPLFRAGCRMVLEKAAGLEVVGEAKDGAEALALIEIYQPHVVLLDIELPGLTGLEVAAQVASLWPDIRVVLLSGHTGKQYVFEALEAGVSAYLAKDAGFKEIEGAVRAAARGESYFSRAVSRHVTAFFQTAGKSRGSRTSLPRRQRQVVVLKAKGHTAKEIAGKLKIDKKTVYVHLQTAMKRLGLHNLAELIEYAKRTGML